MNAINAGSVTVKRNTTHDMFNPTQLSKILGTLTEQLNFCVAYSGGLDSHVLLHAMCAIASEHPAINVRAIHINHGLNPNADAWAQHCCRVCENLGVEFIACALNLAVKPGDSVEAVARTARYECFANLLQPGENLITAHTQNDQAETLLLQLLRGSGVKGLAAMPIKKTFAHGYLLRPVLTFTREALQEYANAHALQWIEDDSNLALRFDRNYIRHEIMPTLRTRWPQALTTLSRAAEHCAESAALLDQLADMDLKWVSDEFNKALLISALTQLSAQRQRNVLRRWIVLQGHQAPNAKHVQQILATILYASADAQPQLRWDNLEMRRYQDRLYLMALLPRHDATQIIPWDLTTPLTLPSSLGKLTAQTVTNYGISAALNGANITVRFRQGGERCRPVGRKETHALKKLFQDWEIPPWQRDRVPLIYADDTLIAVVGYCVCANYAAQQNQKGYDIVYSTVNELR